ncbi:MAG TPA: hypothetical protein ENL20_09485 [Candidatus Cloacimonetes bacterium]|nr:hypothetical protein [Candidatus Cloacimonadota bacterium]
MLHTGLTSDKWKIFSTDKQLLMIANELNRAKNWIDKKDFEKVSFCYERAFELLDLTVECSKNNNLIRELLRFRELLAMTYSNKSPIFDYVLYDQLLSMNIHSFNL